VLHATFRHGPTPAALKEYERVRLPRAQEVQEGSTSLAKQVGAALITARRGLCARPYVVLC
jgi:2-polyprenyl-6-methoxyphenol hydroxylase-like FAD-dependent oxidoreductase